MKLITSAVVAFLIIIQFNGYIQAETTEDLVARYLELSGITQILSSFPEQIDAMTSQKRITSKNPDLDNEIAAIMKESFNIRLVNEQISHYIAKNVEEEHLQKMISWLQSPLARKITNEELSASSPNSQSNLLHYLADLQSNPPSQERISLIQDIEATTELSELTTNISLNIMRCIFNSINAAMSEDRHLTEKDIDEYINNMRPILKEPLRQQMILSSFYAYRNITSDELREYLKYYKSDIGKKEVNLIGDALSYVIQLWSIEVGNRIIDLAKEESKKVKI